MEHITGVAKSIGWIIRAGVWFTVVLLQVQ